MVPRCLFPILFACLPSLPAYSLSPQCPDITSSKGISSSKTLAGIVGLATDPDSQQPLYCEYHYLSVEENNQVLVEYRDLEQNLIASKQLRYSDNLLQPEVLQQDFRHGERREISFGQDPAQGEIEVVYLKPKSDQPKQVNLILGDNLVIDAGFDAAIRSQWRQLLAGEIIAMDFLSPVHLRTFNLSVRFVDAEDCSVRLAKPDDELCFMIRPTNAFMNLIAKPLWLVYEKATQRLLTYEGSVNLTTLEGDTLEANIRYYYR